MKKISLITAIKGIVFMTIIFLASTLITVSAASYPSKITVGNSTWLHDYLGYGVDLSYKQTSDGKVIYCIEYPKEVPTNGMVMNYTKEADNGLTYILKNFK